MMSARMMATSTASTFSRTLAQAESAGGRSTSGRFFSGCGFGLSASDEAEFRALVTDDLVSGQTTQANLRSGQVAKDPDRSSEFQGDLPDRFDDPLKPLVRAVGEVQPENIDARKNQAAKHVWLGTGRADGGDDLRPNQSMFAIMTARSSG